MRKSSPITLPASQLETAVQADIARTGAPVETQELSMIELLRRTNCLVYAASAKALFDEALKLVIEVTQAELATYFRFEPQSNELVVEAIVGDDSSQHLVGLRLPRQEGMMEFNLVEEQPIIIGDLPGDPRWLRTAFPSLGARMVNLISLPLVVQGKPWGVVQVYNFRLANLDQLDVLRDRIAVEFERREALDNAQRSNERLLGLIDVIGESSGLTDRKLILQKMLEKATELVDAERTSIFLTEPGTGNIGFQIAYQAPSQQERASLHAAPHSEPRRKAGAGHENSPAHLFSRSAITVPIRLQAADGSTPDEFRSLGGLMALNPNQGSFDSEDLQTLNILAQHTSSLLQVAEVFESTEELFLDVIKALVTAIDAKDPYTQGHSHRVSEYSVLIAQALGFNESQVNDVRIGSLLHDVGKIGIPDAILKKEGKLTPEEWVEIKNHPVTGWNILRQVTLLEPVLPAIVEHHEKLDGSGYPYGLQEEQISLMGKIVAVADVFDAMTSDRPYRPAMKVPEVLAYLEENAGILFDLRCVTALKNIVEKNNETE